MGLGRNLNWIRQHGTKAQKQRLCGSGLTSGPKLTEKQIKKMDADIWKNPKRYDSCFKPK